MQDRREKVLMYITLKGSISLVELSGLFPDVSTMTLRRDLEYLEERGDVVRTRGGAKSIMHLSMQREEAYHRRELENSQLKMEIAKKTDSLIDENSCVYFDAGSTVMHIVKALGSKHMFAITCGPNIAMELTKNPNCEISMVCGKLNRRNIALSGLGAVKFLKGINIGTAVIAASGYSPDHNFTCGEFDDAELKRAVIEASRRTIVVMDSTKVGKNHPFTFAKPEDIDFFITDSNFDKKLLSNIKKSGVKII